jgi:hypothetical protein
MIPSFYQAKHPQIVFCFNYFIFLISRKVGKISISRKNGALLYITCVSSYYNKREKIAKRLIEHGI